LNLFSFLSIHFTPEIVYSNFSRQVTDNPLQWKWWFTQLWCRLLWLKMLCHIV